MNLDFAALPVLWTQLQPFLMLKRFFYYFLFIIEIFLLPKFANLLHLGWLAIERFRFPRWRGFWTRDIISLCVVWRQAFKANFSRWVWTWKRGFRRLLLTCEYFLHFMLVFCYLSEIFHMYEQKIKRITNLRSEASGLSGWKMRNGVQEGWNSS